MCTKSELKSDIGAALNDLDRRWLKTPEEWTFAMLRAEHDAIVEHFRKSAEAAGITDYLMRVVLGRTVGWGCFEFGQPYEVMKPLADRRNQYPPYSMDDAINAGMTWFRYALDQGRRSEAIEQIGSLEALLSTLTPHRREFVADELAKMRERVGEQ